MIYNLYKPKTCTSFSVVKQVKKITSEKVGHSGTLDPFADGGLVLGIGKSTKKLSEIIEYDKKYTGIIKMGQKTDTKDLTGSIIKEKDIPNMDNVDLNELANSFIGKHMQKPPMYSAKKIDGVRLYKLARKNISVERKPKEIEVKYLSCSLDGDGKLRIEVECSSGTYIRVLAEEICEKIGTLGHLIELTRTKVGPFNIDESLTVERFEEKWKS